jgi:hypothetical protein
MQHCVRGIAIARREVPPLDLAVNRPVRLDLVELGLDRSPDRVRNDHPTDYEVGYTRIVAGTVPDSSTNRICISRDIACRRTTEISAFDLRLTSTAIPYEFRTGLKAFLVLA